MGKIANDLADEIFVTDDNPRNEEASLIRLEILTTCKRATQIADRKEAIEKAIATMKEGDTLLIAGKGHEDYQIIGDIKIPFDDAQVVRDFIKPFTLL